MQHSQYILSEGVNFPFLSTDNADALEFGRILVSGAVNALFFPPLNVESHVFRYRYAPQSSTGPGEWWFRTASWNRIPALSLYVDVYLDTASKSNSDHTTIKNLTTKRPRVRARSSSLTQTTPASYSAKASYWADSRRSFCKFGLGTTRDLARATPGIEVHGFWTPLIRTVHAIDGWNVEPRNEPQKRAHAKRKRPETQRDELGHRGFIEHG